MQISLSFPKLDSGLAPRIQELLLASSSPLGDIGSVGERNLTLRQVKGRRIMPVLRRTSVIRSLDVRFSKGIADFSFWLPAALVGKEAYGDGLENPPAQVEAKNCHDDHKRTDHRRCCS